MRRRVSLLALLLALPAAALSAQRDTLGPNPVPPAVLFTSDQPLSLTIELPLRDLRGDRGQDSPERDAVIIVPDGAGGLLRLDVKVQTRGRFRLERQICDFPPLRINLQRGQLEGTVFEGQNKLKLVTHCRDRDLAYQQFVLQEYLAYRTYNQLTEASFRVRLLWITYVDAEGRRDPMSRFAFLIEDDDDMAARSGWEVIKVPSIHPYDLRASHLRLLELFQYMIGNTDWSVSRPERGKGYCCHNARVIGNMQGVAVPVPYDFDLAGSVNARYARPAPDLEITYVTERLYRGFCGTRADLEGALPRFVEQREAIYQLYRSQVGLSDEERQRLLDFYDDFYRIIADPDLITSELMERCLPI
jgi:hypothetical protein